MKELQRIREKYSSAGDLIFRSAMNYLAVCGSAAVANTPIGDPDTLEGRMIECAKEIRKLSLSDVVNELLDNKVYMVMSGFTPERDVVGVYGKLEDAKAKFEQEKKAIRDYIADNTGSNECTVGTDDDDYFAIINKNNSCEIYETMIVSKTVE